MFTPGPWGKLASAVRCGDVLLVFCAGDVCIMYMVVCCVGSYDRCVWSVDGRCGEGEGR